MTLRLGVLAFSGLLLVAALALGTHPGAWGVALYLAVYGTVIAGAVLFERGRYRPDVDRNAGVWQPTGERFVDPATGRLTDVYYNPASATTGASEAAAFASGVGEGRMRPDKEKSAP